MRSEFIYPVLIFIPILVIQTTIIPLIEIGGVIPDLIIILLVYYTLKYGQVFGTVLGFGYGLLFDIITGGLLGSAMLSKTISGFITGYFYNENKQHLYLYTYFFSLIVFLAATVDSFIYSFFSAINFSSNLLLLIFQQGIFPGFYTAVISLSFVLFYPKKRWA